jgi:hypothetical protein
MGGKGNYPLIFSKCTACLHACRNNIFKKKKINRHEAGYSVITEIFENQYSGYPGYSVINNWVPTRFSDFSKPVSRLVIIGLDLHPYLFISRPRTFNLYWLVDFFPPIKK